MICQVLSLKKTNHLFREKFIDTTKFVSRRVNVQMSYKEILKVVLTSIKKFINML